MQQTGAAYWAHIISSNKCNEAWLQLLQIRSINIVEILKAATNGNEAHENEDVSFLLSIKVWIVYALSSTHNNLFQFLSTASHFLQSTWFFLVYCPNELTSLKTMLIDWWLFKYSSTIFDLFGNERESLQWFFVRTWDIHFLFDS